MQSALFENNVFLVAQHMMQYAVTGSPGGADAQPHLGVGGNDVFAFAGGEQVFLAVVSDTQWAIFCDAFGPTTQVRRPPGQQQPARARTRDWLIPACSSASAGSALPT